MGPNGAGVVDGWSHLRDVDTGRDRLVELYSNPRFSPDGRSILGVATDLVIGPADGGTPVRTLYPGQPQGGYDFSPDGQKILLVAGDPGVTWIVDVASGEKVTTTIPKLPSWQRLAP